MKFGRFRSFKSWLISYTILTLARIAYGFGYIGHNITKLGEWMIRRYYNADEIEALRKKQIRRIK